MVGDRRPRGSLLLLVVALGVGLRLLGGRKTLLQPRSHLPPRLELQELQPRTGVEDVVGSAGDVA